jgi:hypothetical protein
MVLLNQVIQILDLPQFDRLGKDASGFELSYGFRVGSVFIDIDHTRNRCGGGKVS